MLVHVQCLFVWRVNGSQNLNWLPNSWTQSMLCWRFFLFFFFSFFWERGKTILLGSNTLGTKCIRTSFCICRQTLIKTFSLGLDLLKVCFNVSLELSNCRKLLFNSARLDWLKNRLDRLRIADQKFFAVFSHAAQAHMTCRVKCFTPRIKGKTLVTF